MAMKESNKDRAKRLAQEAEQVKPKSGVEGWISQDSFPRPTLTNKHFKWIAIGVGVSLVALLIL